MFKIEWNKKYTTIAAYTVIVILVATFGILVLFNMLTAGILFEFIGRFFQLISPLIYGFVISYLINPLMKFFEATCFAFIERKKKRRRLRRALSLISTYIVVVLFITLFILLIIPQITSSYADLTKKLSSYIDSAQGWADNFVQSIPIFGNTFANFNEFLDSMNISQYLDNFISNSSNLIQTVASYIVSYTGSIVVEVKNAVIGIMLSVYFLLSKEVILAQIKKIMSAFFKPAFIRRVVYFARETNKTFGSYIAGKILESIIVGLLTFIVLGIFNIPYYPIVALIVGVTDIIPIFGPIIGSIPSALIIFIASPIKAIWFIVIVVIIQQLDSNIIGPKILGERTGLSAMWVIISLTVAGGLFGVAGMILGVPLFAVIYVWIKTLVENRLKKKALPTSTVSYFTDGEASDIWDPDKSQPSENNTSPSDNTTADD